MNFLKSAAVVVAFGVGATSMASVAGAQSLTDALINAYNHSASLKSGRAGLRGSDEGVAQAWSALRPKLDASGSFGNSNSSLSAIGSRTTSNLALSLSLTLWDGGATKLGIEVAKLNVEALRQTLKNTEQQILLDAATAFMDMRRDAQFLDLAENNRAVIAKQVQAARDRFEVGEIRRTDVSQAEARLAGALSVIALRQGTLEISRQAYFNATGHYPGDLKTPPRPPKTPASLEAAKSIALRTHPSILRAKDASKIAELNIYRAQAAMKPAIRLSGSLSSTTGSSVSGDTLSLSLGGSAPIYHGGALTSAYRQALALEEQSRFDIQLAGQRITQNVTRFWAQLGIARASITARQKEVRSTRTALSGIREEANLGARTTLDVLDAERAMVEAQTNLVSARRDENVAAYSLLSAMGLLTVKHLQLGIKTYDVKANYKKVSHAPGPSNRAKLLEKIFTRAGKK
ncbi:MAG: TolC family outer membrane protein [Alphaproteobacteria bacterium]|nr:TolC family outer membrane protein [Alphaproteobacteria bacterium]